MLTDNITFTCAWATSLRARWRHYLYRALASVMDHPGYLQNTATTVVFLRTFINGTKGNMQRMVHVVVHSFIQSFIHSSEGIPQMFSFSAAMDGNLSGVSICWMSHPIPAPETRERQSFASHPLLLLSWCREQSGFARGVAP
jgi:hypothetical protein